MPVRSSKKKPSSQEQQSPVAVFLEWLKAPHPFYKLEHAAATNTLLREEEVFLAFLEHPRLNASSRFLALRTFLGNNLPTASFFPQKAQVTPEEAELLGLVNPYWRFDAEHFFIGTAQTLMNLPPERREILLALLRDDAPAQIQRDLRSSRLRLRHLIDLAYSL